MRGEPLLERGVDARLPARPGGAELPEDVARPADREALLRRRDLGSTHPAQRLPKARGQLFEALRAREVGVGSSRRVGCADGAVRITRAGDVKDVVICAGEAWVADSQGTALVTGLETAVVTLGH